MIRYLVGDASVPADRPAVIVHVVNDAGAWGAGFTASLDKHWPLARAHYRAWSRDGTMHLGGARIHVLSDGLHLAHLCAQRGLPHRNNPRPVDYDALRQALRTFHQASAAHGVPAEATVHMPRIGTGYGGGRWAVVEGIVIAELAGLDVAVYDLAPR